MSRVLVCTTVWESIWNINSMAGVRQEQDIYVRLIDSVTKQVRVCLPLSSPQTSLPSVVSFNKKSLSPLDYCLWRLWKKPSNVAGFTYSWNYVQVGRIESQIFFCLFTFIFSISMFVTTYLVSQLYPGTGSDIPDQTRHKVSSTHLKHNKKNFHFL